MATVQNDSSVRLYAEVPRTFSVLASITASYPPLSDSSWVGVPLVAVSGAPGGATVRRSSWVGGGGGAACDALGSNIYFPIVAGRTYRTRFWAKATGANGLLYHALQQFIGTTGTTGPTNGGLAPYKPGGITGAATTTWTLFDYTWSSADWQAGVTHVKPNFLLNYTGTAGYWEVSGYEFSDVTDVVAASAAAIAAQADATSALTQLTNIASDNILSPSEKPAVVLDYSNLINEQSGIDGQATAYGITTEKTAYDTAVSALTTYLGTITGWNTIPGTDVTIVGTTFRTKFTDVYTARQVLLNKIDSIAGTRANWTSVASRPANVAALAGTEEINNATIVVGGRNLVQDSSFERGTRTSFPEQNLLSVCVPSSIVGSAFGNNALFMESSSGASGKDAYAYMGGQKAAVKAGTTYALSYYFASATSGSIAAANCYIRLSDASHVGFPIAVPSSGGVFYRNIMIWTCPAGITSIEFRFGVVCTGYTWFAADGVQVEEGNKATQWAPAPEDYAADTALAQAAANAANAAIANIASDSILSPGEKPTIVQDYAVIIDEQATIDARATAYGITTEKTSYDSYVSALTTYLGTLTGWNTIPGTDVAIVGTTFRAKFRDVYSTRQILLNKIDEIAGTVSTWPGVSGTGKPADNASADLTLVGTGMTIVGNTVTKTGGTHGLWDAQVYSKGGYVGGCIAEFKIPGTNDNFMCGLNTDPTTDADFSSLDYAWYVSSAVDGRVYESGSAVGGGAGTIFATLAAGDILDVTTDNVNVYYRQNGILRLTRTLAPAHVNAKFHLDSSFNSVGATISNIRFAPFANQDFAATGGATKPSDNATADITLTGTNMTIVGNTATKTGGVGASWDAQVTSPNGHIGGCIAEMRAPASGYAWMFGINEDPLANAYYDTLDYAWYCDGTANLRIYESNTPVGGGGGAVFATMAANDILDVTSDNVNVYYRQNGTIRRTVALPPAKVNVKMYLDSSIYSLGCVFTNIRFAPFANQDFAATGGDTKPVDNATVGAADAATSMGFNPQFTAWPAGASFPTGWTSWTGACSKETSITRTAPYAVRWTVSGDVGMQANVAFTTTPTSVGTYLAGTFDVNITTNNGGTCRPGYLFRLYTDSSLAGFVDNPVLAAPGLLGWQRIRFTASVGATQRIYGMTVFQMGSWTGFAGGGGTSGSSCVFDNLTFDWEIPLTETQYISLQPSLATLTNLNASGNSNGTVVYGTRTATPTNMTAPYIYSWTMSPENGTCFLLNPSSATVTIKGTSTNSYVLATVNVVVTDARGKSVSGSLYVSEAHGSGTLP